MKNFKKYITLIITTIIILVITIFFIINHSKSIDITNNFIPENQLTANSDIPSDFLLPFNINDIDGQNGEINPIGVYRFSKDTVGRGHSGLDVPLFQGVEIYAVSNGEIILIDSASDQWGGMKIYQLLEKTKEGEGWIFNYEHVTPSRNIMKGVLVKKGELIATKTAPSNFTAHFQMSKIFNNFEYTKDSQCWPELLENNAKNDFNNWWDIYKNSEHLISSWNSNIEEGKYPFRGLLDKSNYPEGLQLCYSPGTDTR